MTLDAQRDQQATSVAYRVESVSSALDSCLRLPIPRIIGRYYNPPGITTKLCGVDLVFGDCLLPGDGVDDSGAPVAVLYR